MLIAGLAPSTSTYVLSSGYLHLLLTIVGALVILCGIIIFFTYKLRRVNREIRERNEQVEEMNTRLQKKNTELAVQKEILAREHYESDKFFRILLQSANDGISFYDKDWNLMFSNSAFYSVIGYDSVSYQGEDPSTLIHPDDKDYQTKRTEALKSNGFHESELRLRHRDGHYVILSAKSVTIKDEKGATIGALTVSRDITRMKQVHEELIKANF